MKVKEEKQVKEEISNDILEEILIVLEPYKKDKEENPLLILESLLSERSILIEEKKDFEKIVKSIATSSKQIKNVSLVEVFTQLNETKTKQIFDFITNTVTQELPNETKLNLIGNFIDRIIIL